MIEVMLDNLRDSISRILSVVDKKSNRPILSYSLFSVSNGRLDIYSTDLEVSAKVSLPVQSTENMTFCVNVRNFFDILRELPNSKLNLKVSSGLNGNYLDLKCDNIEYSLVILNTDDFPNLVFESKNSESFSIGASVLIETINKTSHSMSTDESMMYLNGIFLQAIDNKLRAVSTDGHRLALYDTDVNVGKSEMLTNGIIIPRKGVMELKKIAEVNPDAELKISVDESFLYANYLDSYFLSIRLFSREYVKYQAVIPAKTTYNLEIDKHTFLNSLKRIKIMSNEKSNGVRVKLLKEKMSISANHPSFGNALESIPINYTGKDMEIGFNAKYLIETLSVLKDGEIRIELNNELNPVVIKSCDTQDFLGIVMPLKL
jgi:DNA polymerase-3 subunit beta